MSKKIIRFLQSEDSVEFDDNKKMLNKDKTENIDREELEELKELIEFVEIRLAIEELKKRRWPP
jgi:hypothetical protein